MPYTRIRTHGSKFDFAPKELKSLMENRGQDGVQMISELGGIDEICKKLKTDPWDGIEDNPEEIKSRMESFGINYVPPTPPKRLATLICDALKDVTILILIVAALLSLAVSFYDFKPKNDQSESGYGWIEGSVILASVAIVVLATAFNNYSKELRFVSLQNRIDSLQTFAVVRSGDVKQISVKEIVVGDVCQIKYGDLLPADGIILQAYDLKVDESTLTGESDQVPKDTEIDPMLLAGTHVIEGSGKMLIVAVGPHSQNGQIIMLLQADKKSRESWCKRRTEKYRNQLNSKIQKLKTQNRLTENRSVESGSFSDSGETEFTKGKSVLQAKLSKLAVFIGLMAIAVAGIIMLTLTIRFTIQIFVVEKKSWEASYLSHYVGFFVISVTILVVTLPEGLPLAVTIALAYSVKKMMHDNNLVRHLDACETMGNATVICSDKTGTLTTNRMTVVHSYICGKHYVKHTPTSREIHPQVADLIAESISINTNYASQIVPSSNPKHPPKQEGNKTECALLDIVLALGRNYDDIRDEFPEEMFVMVYTFNSVRKSMSTIIRLGPNKYRVYTKGAFEIIVDRCVSIHDEKGRKKTLSIEDRKYLSENVAGPMAQEGLRMICVAYRDLEGQQINWKEESDIVNQLTCLGIFGIEDPVRDEVPEAIKTCQKAGITVIMLTGDNINTARTIATKCGIITPDNNFLVLEGKEFNKRIRNANGDFSQELFDEVWPKLRVLARSNPLDKYTLVKGIIDSKISTQREVVAVTGDGTNDAPALKTADVGFAMGISGTDVAKAASDIIITDDNFSSIVKAVIWGRNVYDSIGKFLQFQLTVNFVTVIVATVGAVKVAVPLGAVQMLWVNLIMDTLASLALASDYPTRKLLERKPYGRTKPLISPIMWKNIIGQGLYQLTVTFILMFYADKIFDIKTGFQPEMKRMPTQHFTLVFNAFVIMTLFNEINARKINGERNVFEGMHKNLTFCSIWLGTFIIQIVIVEFGENILWTKKLSLYQWLLSLGCGLGALPWAQLIITLPPRKMD